MLKLIQVLILTVVSGFAPQGMASALPEFVLNGSGLRKATFLRIKVYEASLFLRTKASTPDAIYTQLRRPEDRAQIRMKFLRSVSKSQIQDAWLKGFRENCLSTPGATAADCEKNLQILTEGVQKIDGLRDGDELRVEIAAEQVRISRAAETITLKGSSGFGAQFVGIWIGANPPDEGLKRDLLGISDAH